MARIGPPTIVGPASATDSAVVLFDGTTGKLAKDSATTIADIIASASGAGGGIDVTTEALTFAVDYNLGGAAVPTAGTKFSTQAEITAYLAGQGTTAFKNLMDCWDALPASIAHTITFNCAAGVHRPRASDTSTACFWFRRKSIIPGGSCVIQGAAVASYAVQHSLSALTIASHDTGGSSDEPAMTFSGTPFAGLSIKGYFATIGSTAYVVHDHDDSTLYVTAELSGITNGVTTCSVACPATVFRNSLADSARAVNGSVFYFQHDAGVATSPLTVNDATIDPWDRHGVNFADSISMTRCLIDFRRSVLTYALSMTGQSTYALNVSTKGKGITYTLTSCAVACAYLNTATNEHLRRIHANSIAGDQRNSFTAAWCYFEGSAFGWDFKIPTRVNAYNCVFDANFTSAATLATTYGATGAFRLSPGGIFDATDVSGKLTTFRNFADSGGHACACVYLDHAEVAFSQAVGTLVVVSENNDNPLIRLGAYARLDLGGILSGSSSRLLDGGSNLDVGIDVVGPHAQVNLAGALTTVTGAAGDVRLGGNIVSYATIAADYPLCDDSFNRITVTP